MPITMSHHAPIQRHIPMTEAEQAARVQLAACYHVFAHLGWVESIFNHITLRVPGPEKIFLINPFGRLYREVTASNLVAIDIDGNPVRATEYPVNRAGFVIHSAIHATVAEAHCVMHTHTVSGMAVSCLAEGLMHDSFNGAQLKGRVAYHDFEGVTVRPDEQTRLLASIGDKKAVILRNHGLLAWGGSLPEATRLPAAVRCHGAPARFTGDGLPQLGGDTHRMVDGIRRCLALQRRDDVVGRTMFDGDTYLTHR